jgi:hypothetical protein
MTYRLTNSRKSNFATEPGKGDCVAARGADGKEFVVVGEGLKSGSSTANRGSHTTAQ